ncbi:MAG: short chain dehydrogenase, partial [Chitinophagaceae bacterium]|nr:short chain dehydrogenase [Chitinophagaceae bacterium]
MKILVVGGKGTIGKRVVEALSAKHDLVIGGRNTGDVTVDISSAASIADMFTKIGKLDGIVCTAGTGYYGPFDEMTQDHLMP